MSFGESFTRIRKDKGISRKDFADQLGIPYTTLRNYEKDQREPGHKLLIKMATLLSVSVDELIGHQVETKSTQLTPIEQAHIQKYRSLDPYGKEAVDGVLDVEWRRCQASEKEIAAQLLAELEKNQPSRPKIRISVAASGGGTYETEADADITFPNSVQALPDEYKGKTGDTDPAP